LCKFTSLSGEITLEAVAVENIKVEIDGQTILDSITLDVKKGEFFSLIGANGSGKTTLLKALCRIKKFCSGEIRINGVSIKEMNQKELVRQVGYVAQFNVIPEFTVREFVLFSRYAYLKPFATYTREDLDIVHEALKITFTENIQHRKMNTLSGGERQRVIIASALAQKCSIILLDEPTTYLDPRFQMEINELIKKINQEMAITVINVTHDLNSACLLSDRVAALKNGKIAFVGKPAEIYTNPGILTDIFETPFQVFYHPQTNHQVIMNFRGADL